MRLTPGLTHVSHPLRLAMTVVLTRAELAALSSPEAVDDLVNAGLVRPIRCGETELLDVQPIGELIDDAAGIAEAETVETENAPGVVPRGVSYTRPGPFVEARRKFVVRTLDTNDS